VTNLSQMQSRRCEYVVAQPCDKGFFRESLPHAVVTCLLNELEGFIGSTEANFRRVIVTNSRSELELEGAK
jgi:hypothetical protein